MSDRELVRAAVLRRVQAGELRLQAAAPLLGVSYRQAKRLAARYRATGAKGLVHRHVGRRSNRALAPAQRATVLALVQAHYGGRPTRGPGQRFGPTLAVEHLARDHGVQVSVSTLTRWMRAAGLWGRVRRARPAHQRRERKAHFGELVQLDGSFHAWFEGRGPRGCLMAMVDDATGQTVLRLGAEETIWAAAGVLQAWITAYGIPQALYTDWKNVYLRAPTTKEKARGEVPLTQFGRMCAKLGIRVIGAASPQAKGRVERGHSTHQDRLIKKLRLAGIRDVVAANAFLAADYLPSHNARFAITPASAVDHHAPRATRHRRDADVFCLEMTRRVGHDHVVQHEGRSYQLDPGVRGRVPVKSHVLVRVTEDGVVRLLHVNAAGHERVLHWTPAVARAARPPRALGIPATLPRSPGARYIPAPTHPWRLQQAQWRADAIARKTAGACSPAASAPA